MSHFPKPFHCTLKKIRFLLNVANNTTKSDLKKATGIDTSNLAAKFGLASLKAVVDKMRYGLTKNCSSWYI